MENQTSNNNKRIAKNILLPYSRMLLTMLVFVVHQLCGISGIGCGGLCVINNVE